MFVQAVAPSQSRDPNPNAPYIVPAPKRTAAPSQIVSAAQAAPCSPDALKVQEIAGNVHGNYHSVKLGFRNQTNVACRLSGYPIVALFNGEGQDLGSIAVEKMTTEEVREEMAEALARPAASPGSAGSASGEVVLMPKAVAAFQVVWSAGENCSRVARLLVTAPGTTRTFSVSQPMSVCAGRIQVTSLGLDQGDD